MEVKLYELELRKARPLQDVVGGDCVIPSLESMRREQLWRERCIRSSSLGALFERSRANKQIAYKNLAARRKLRAGDTPQVGWVGCQSAMNSLAETAWHCMIRMSPRWNGDWRGHVCLPPHAVLSHVASAVCVRDEPQDTSGDA